MKATRPKALFWGVLAVSAGCFLQGSSLGDGIAARTLFEYAVPRGLSSMEAVDAARMASQVKPWQPRFLEARRLRQQVIDARATVLSSR